MSDSKKVSQEKFEDAQVPDAMETLISIVKKSFDLKPYNDSEEGEKGLEGWAEYTSDNITKFAMYCGNELKIPLESSILLVKICWVLCWHVNLGRYRELLYKKERKLFKEERKLFDDYITASHPGEKMVTVDTKMFKKIIQAMKNKPRG